MPPNRRTEKKPPKSAVTNDYSQVKVDASSAPKFAVTREQTPAAPPAFDSASAPSLEAHSEPIESINRVAEELQAAPSFPLNQLLLLIAGAAVCLWAIVAPVIIWTQAANKAPMLEAINDVKKSADATQATLKEQADLQANQLGNLPTAVSERLAAQLPIMEQTLQQANGTAQQLSGILEQSQKQIGALGNQQERDFAYREAKESIDRIDRMRVELDVVTKSLKELSSSLTPVNTATIVACADNNRLPLRVYAQSLKSSFTGVPLLAPLSQVAVYKISNGELAKPALKDFGVNEWQPLGDSGGVSLNDSLRDLDSLVFPQSGRQRVIALVSEGAEPPPKSAKVELNAILIQFVRPTNTNDPDTITPTLSVSKLEGWVSRCRETGGKFVYLPLPVAADAEKRKVLDELNNHLITRALRDMLLDSRATTPVNLRPISNAAP